MTIDAALEKQVLHMFLPLKAFPAASSMDSLGSLTTALNALCPKTITKNKNVGVKREHVRLFATAAVESWMRGVHSLLVSAALTKGSVIWSSVSGYYASHYSMRALAHLAGTFLLFGRKMMVQMDWPGSSCEFRPNAERREHVVYWRSVKSLAQFANDPFFSTNDHDNLSDQAHRNRASYADHVMHVGSPGAIGVAETAQHIRKIAGYALRTPPPVSRDGFPQVENVQYRAYYRLVAFRNVVDQILGGSNNCWNVWRNPPWCEGIVNFQLIEPGSALAAIKN